MRNYKLFVHGLQGMLTVDEVDEDNLVRLTADMGFGLIRAGIPLEDARQMAHQILRETDPSRWEDKT